MEKQELIKKIELMKAEIRDKTNLKGYSLFLQKTGQHLPSPSRMLKPLTWDKYKDIPKYILQKASEKGKIIHDAIEVTLNSGIAVPPMELNSTIEPFWNAFESYYNEHKIINVASELRVWNKEYNLSGVIDFVGYIDGKPYIIDWKTTAKVDKNDVAMQLYFYKKALESFDINIDNLAIGWMKKDGKFKLIEVDQAMFPIYENVFTSLNIIKDYRKNILNIS